MRSGHVSNLGIVTPTADDLGAWAAKLVLRLTSYPRENEHCEFKVGNFKPDEIGEYVSALSNSAAVAGLAHGYMVWGVRDDDHEVVGTAFKPHTTKIGNEELRIGSRTVSSPRWASSSLTARSKASHSSC
ncbi:MAG: AlbA family DNA-binding domain-containing protein [Jatrophihabitans sp.]